MDFIKEWTICVCVTLVISVIFSTLSPNGRLSSFYKFIISIFIFLSFVYPFTVSNISIDNEYVNDFVIEDKSAEISQNMINSKVLNVLVQNGITGADVTSKIEFLDDEIYIDDIQIAVPDDYDLDVIKKLIYDNLSINARVIHIGE